MEKRQSLQEDQQLYSQASFCHESSTGAVGQCGEGEGGGGEGGGRGGGREGGGGRDFHSGRKVPRHTQLEHILNLEKSPKQAEYYYANKPKPIIIYVQILIWVNFTQTMYILHSEENSEMNGDLYVLTCTHTYIHPHIQTILQRDICQGVKNTFP